MKGKILLWVEEIGEAWYLNSVKLERYYLEPLGGAAKNLVWLAGRFFRQRRRDCNSNIIAEL